MTHRYVVHIMTIDVGIGDGRDEHFTREKWIGLEFDESVDIEEFSRETGYDLVPADGISLDELKSVGVTNFEKILD